MNGPMFEFGSDLRRATLEFLAKKIAKSRREFHANKREWPNVVIIHPDDDTEFQESLGPSYLQDLESRTGMTVEVATVQDSVKPKWFRLDRRDEE